MTFSAGNIHVVKTNDSLNFATLDVCSFLYTNVAKLIVVLLLLNRYNVSSVISTYLLSCLFVSISPMRAMLAPIPREPSVNISAASVVPPG